MNSRYGGGNILTKHVPAQAKKANGAKPPRRPKQKAPQLSEKAKKLALKAFRMTYEAHHGKSS